MVLNFQIVPGKSVGFFTIGMTISDAISKIQTQKAIISKAELKYSGDDPLSQDIVIDLIEDGILLRFQPSSQRLIVIEIYDVHKVFIFYFSLFFLLLEYNLTKIIIKQ